MGCKNRDKNKADQIKLPIFKSFIRIFVDFFFVFPFIPRTFAPQNYNQSIKTIEKYKFRRLWNICLKKAMMNS